ncbi:MAG TPA: DUF559 domain-containing protein [Bacillota bacterium]|nr:DUF559 domain-containing protein [Bacillota bacterium]
MGSDHSLNRSKAEKLLASLLTKHKISFRQNVHLEGYEFDFVLPEYRIIIEVDGFFHLSTSQQKLDTLKENLLTQKGYTLIRFQNYQIYQNPERTIQAIKKCIQQLSSLTNSPITINDAWKEPLRHLKLPQENPKKRTFLSPEEFFSSLDKD